MYKNFWTSGERGGSTWAFSSSTKFLLPWWVSTLGDVMYIVGVNVLQNFCDLRFLNCFVVQRNLWIHQSLICSQKYQAPILSPINSMLKYPVSSGHPSNAASYQGIFRPSLLATQIYTIMSIFFTHDFLALLEVIFLISLLSSISSPFVYLLILKIASLFGCQGHVFKVSIVREWFIILYLLLVLPCFLLPCVETWVSWRSWSSFLSKRGSLLFLENWRNCLSWPRGKWGKIPPFISIWGRNFRFFPQASMMTYLLKISSLCILLSMQS